PPPPPWWQEVFVSQKHILQLFKIAMLLYKTVFSEDFIFSHYQWRKFFSPLVMRNIIGLKVQNIKRPEYKNIKISKYQRIFYPSDFI
ncbi:hypothetical protein, partial [Acinetobacter sp. YH16052]